MTDWLSQLWDTLTSVSVPLLILGLAFQTAQTVLVALAWRNILRASYPEGDVRYRAILGYYAGGNGLNAILPASAGTVAMLGLFRTSIPGSTVAGLLGATVVENIFFGVVGGLVYLWLFLSVAGSFEVQLGWFADHWFLTLIIVVVGAALIGLVVRILRRRLHETWQNTKEGGVILSMPRKFLVQVVGVEAASYVARMGVNADLHVRVRHSRVAPEHLPDRRRGVDLVDRRDRAGCGGGADRPRVGGAEGRRAAGDDLGVQHRPGADHDGVERRLRAHDARPDDWMGSRRAS